MNYTKLQEWSRYFHHNVPPNTYYKEKIPYKTIIVVIILLFITFYIVNNLPHSRNYLLLPWFHEVNGKRNR